MNRDFVNTWVLAKDLPSIAEQTEDPAVKAAALTCKENAIYPVDSHVLSSSGEFVEGLWVEDALMMRAGQRHPSITRPAPEYKGMPDDLYRQFLESARDQAQEGK